MGRPFEHVCRATLVLAGCFPAHVLGVQPRTVAQPGDRVRIYAPDVTPDPIRGTLRTSDSDPLIVAVRGRAGVVSIPRSAVTSFEVSGGNRHPVVRVAALLTGAAVGAAAGFAIPGGLQSEGANPFVTMGVGVAVGGWVGWHLTGERWERVSLPRGPGAGAGVSFTLAPVPRGAAATVEVRF